MTPFFMFENFLAYLRFEKRYSEHTLIAYRQDIVQFFEFNESNIDDPSSVTSRQIRSWIVELIEIDRKSTTVSRKLSSLRTYFSWLRKQGVVANSPVTGVNAPKQQKRLPVFARKKDLSQDQIQLVFGSDFSGLRDQLMFELLYQTGIRLSELITIRQSDISQTAIKVLGKRNKERIVPISSALYVLIKSYEQFRNNLTGGHSDHLLVLENGRKLYPKFVYRRINTYLKQMTDLDKRSPHVLRHTFATHMLNNGAGLEVIKELLGHASLAATQVYTHNSFAELTKVYSQSHPRGHKN